MYKPRQFPHLHLDSRSSNAASDAKVPSCALMLGYNSLMRLLGVRLPELYEECSEEKVKLSGMGLLLLLLLLSSKAAHARGAPRADKIVQQWRCRNLLCGARCSCRCRPLR